MKNPLKGDDLPLYFQLPAPNAGHQKKLPVNGLFFRAETQ
jgi:hypothetical protein